MKLTGPVLVEMTDGALILTVGAVLSTLNDVLGPAAEAGFPHPSTAVPGAREIPRVPSPVIFWMETIGEKLPAPLIITVPFAVPVLLSVMSAADRVTADAPV